MDMALLAGSGNPSLAGAVAGHLGIDTTRCTTERFPDGEAHVAVGPVQGRDVYVVQPTGPPADQHLMELLLIADACRRAGGSRLTAVIPYFGYARHDRRTHPGEAVGARVVGDLLATVGIDRALVVDPHTEALEALCSVPLDVISAQPILAQALRPGVLPNAVVVAPDEGALKLADRYATELGLPLAFVRKRRLSGETVSVGEVVGDVQGRQVVLVDDMVSTGGTIAGAIAAVLDRGSVSGVLVAATHGLLVGPIAARLRGLPIDGLFVTNTLPPHSDVPCPVTVIDIAALLAKRIVEFHHDTQGETGTSRPMASS
ncbi:MAG: ribose-phosphate pyrophosphokinase [Acidimicrobiales bacterium]|nr:ribose-phosphate pyrophosphokinase [Acidimicrobiales bacterium]